MDRNKDIKNCLYNSFEVNIYTFKIKNTKRHVIFILIVYVFCLEIGTKYYLITK